MLPSACGASARTATNVDAWFEPKRFALLLALLVLAAFPDVIFGSRTFFYRDFAIFGYPLAHYHRESFWRGEVPLWNPFNNCGLPFLAQWNTMTLYPLSIFYLLFPLSWSLGVFCVLHLYLAGVGMYFLGYQWTGRGLPAALAGVAFAFNGLTLSCLKWPNNMAALAWMPVVVLLAEMAWRRGGRAVILASLAAATQVLSGGPEIILFTWLIVGALWVAELIQRSSAREASLEACAAEERLLGRERLDQQASIVARFVAVVLLVTGLVAAQMLPFLDLLAHSQRDATYSDASWAMPSWGWTNFLVPLFRCFPSYHGVFAQQGQYWISSYYAGIGVFLLAGAGFALNRDARTWLLAGLTIVSLVLALGDASQVYRGLIKVLPPLQIIRFPIKFVVIANFALPLLAAFGVAALLQRSLVKTSVEVDADENAFGAAGTAPPKSWKHQMTTLAPLMAIAVACFVVMGVVLWVAWMHPLSTNQWSSTWRSGVSRSLFLMAILAVLAGCSSSHRTKLSSLLGLGLVGLQWLDVITHTPRLCPTIEPSVYEAGLGKDHLKLAPEPRLGDSRTMISPLADFRLNHLALTNAVDDVLYSRLSMFANANLLDSVPKVDGFFSLYVRAESRIRSLLYATTNTSLPRVERFLGVSQVTAEDKVIHWKPRTNFLAFATGGQAPVFADEAQTLRAMTNADWEPRRTVYLLAEDRGLVATTHATEANVKVVRFAAQQIELEVDASGPAWVVLAQTHYPAWKASLDGRATRIWRANHAFQAVEVPAGRHVVRLNYQDNSFRIGAVTSVVTLLISVGLWMRWNPVSKRAKA